MWKLGSLVNLIEVGFGGDAKETLAFGNSIWHIPLTSVLVLKKETGLDADSFTVLYNYGNP